MFNLYVEIAGRDVSIDAYGSPLAAVREVHSMARAYAAMQEDADVRRGEVDLLFGKGVEQQERRERFFAGSLRGRKPSKAIPLGVDPQPVTGKIGDLVFSITPAFAEMGVEAGLESLTTAEVYA